MKFKYDNITYSGTREEIIESLKFDLENNKTLKYGQLVLYLVKKPIGFLVVVKLMLIVSEK